MESGTIQCKTLSCHLQQQQKKIQQTAFSIPLVKVETVQRSLHLECTMNFQPNLLTRKMRQSYQTKAYLNNCYMKKRKETLGFPEYIPMLLFGQVCFQKTTEANANNELLGELTYQQRSAYGCHLHFNCLCKSRPWLTAKRHRTRYQLLLKLIFLLCWNKHHRTTICTEHIQWCRL